MWSRGGLADLEDSMAVGWPYSRAVADWGLSLNYLFLKGCQVCDDPESFHQLLYWHLRKWSTREVWGRL